MSKKNWMIAGGAFLAGCAVAYFGFNPISGVLKLASKASTSTTGGA